MESSDKQQRRTHYGYLLSEMVKRDFINKYKGTVLGVFWSVLSPLASYAVMLLIFTNLISRDSSYRIYMLCGSLVFSFFSSATTQGMSVLLINANIYSRLNIPKLIFLIASNISSLINFLITLVVLFFMIFITGVPFTVYFAALPIPIILLMIFNFGLSAMLAVVYVRFRDMKHLYGVFTNMLMWFSAIFYYTDSITGGLRYIFYLNPVYIYITFARSLILEAAWPPLYILILSGVYAALSLCLGVLVYQKNHNKLYQFI